MLTTTPVRPSAPPAAPPAAPRPPVEGRSPELAEELSHLETTERAQRDRRRQEELARLRDLARHD